MDFTTFKDNRAHCYEFVKHLPGIIVMKGAPEWVRPGTDYEQPINQESNFFYLTGIEEPCAWFVWDLPKNEAHLFHSIPPQSTKMWMKVEDFDSIVKRLPADGHHRVEELPQFVQALVADGKTPIQTIELTTIAEIRDGCKLDDKVPIFNNELMYWINEARAIKTPKELKLLRIAASHASEAHIAVQKLLRPGITETEVEALWYLYCHRNAGTSGKFQAFLPICSFGADTAILHHDAEDNVPSKPEDNLLFDTGSTFHFYCSDITRTYPISGKFSGPHKWLYETVLKAQLAVIDMLKPGVQWIDCHTRALEVIGQRLIEQGILHAPKGRKEPLTLTEAMEKDLVAPFMPHGLGHMLGIDAHDVAGYFREGPKRSTRPSYDRLRLSRELKPGFVVTVEPGCYFNPEVVNPFIEAHPGSEEYIDLDQLKNTWYGVGGVRIEDDVLVTETGCEVLTYAPKTVEDIEKTMAEGKGLPLPW